MIRAIVIPLLAIAGVVFAAYSVVQGSKPPRAMPPVVQPSLPPYPSFVAGSGLVEASTENVAIGTPVAGIAVEVAARVGAQIHTGDLLFRVDDREQTAQALLAQAALDVARAELARLEQGTRPELLMMARARTAQANAALSEAQANLALIERVADKRATSEEELTRRRYAVDVARARVDEAAQDVALLEAGAWAPDIEIARARVAQAQAVLDAANIDVERRRVRATVDATILQVNLRAGEFASAGGSGPPPVVLGATRPLHVRIDIDEHDAWRVRADAPATAIVRGNAEMRFDLRFVRFEAMIVPKRSLSGESTERVDTRVLQAIYQLDPGDSPIYVGQQVDAYIEALPLVPPPSPPPMTTSASTETAR
ncbi:MAG: biotin/lipoyl-binding protein [Phycisphaerales bacterium]|nr:biotin/lipoyl-binding protein [Phycisphaerales bacterium]